MMKWPSGYRALRKLVGSFTRQESNDDISQNNIKEDHIDCEGGDGESKEN